MSPPRLAVLGAGPIGLEAALEAARRGYDVRVFERRAVGASVLDWGHVRLFSPWSMNVSALGRERLTSTGWRPPVSEGLPTGRDVVERYLVPLASLPELQGRVETGWNVVAVGRTGILKHERVGSDERLAHPFRIMLEDAAGTEREETADFVIDATGVWGNPNGFGDGGLPPPGERHVANRIARRIEDVLGRAREKYSRQTTLLVGHGHSAATALLDLIRLAGEEPGTQIVWALRASGASPCPEIADDPLPERARVASQANMLVRSRPFALQIHAGAGVRRLQRRGERISATLALPAGSIEVDVDRILACTGFGPDETLYRELQVHQCYASLGPMRLAGLLQGAGSADCLARRSFGSEALRSPEPGFLVLGAKSYGRNPNFLLRVGHEQVLAGFTLLDAWRGVL